MKYTVTHDLYGQIECTESFWTSKKTVTINGVALKQVGKMKRGQMTYEYDTDEGKKASNCERLVYFRHSAFDRWRDDSDRQGCDLA